MTEENFNQTEESRPSPAANPKLIPAAIIIAGVLIAAAVFYTNYQKRSVPALSGNAAVGASAASIADDAPFLGDSKAPVTVVEFGDFQCPFCGRLFKTVEPQVLENYVKPGKVKFVYRNYVFLGPESQWAALAAECANEQGQFWQYHNYLYSHQQGENGGAFSQDNLKRFARELKLDGAKFDACLDSNKYLDKINKDTEDGKNLGVAGTPATFINGELLQGALPYESFQSAIEAALKKPSQ